MPPKFLHKKFFHLFSSWLILFLFVGQISAQERLNRHGEVLTQEKQDELNQGYLTNEYAFICFYYALIFIPDYVNRFQMGFGYPVTKQEQAIHYIAKKENDGRWYLQHFFHNDEGFYISQQNGVLKIELMNGESKQIDMRYYLETMDEMELRNIDILPLKKDFKGLKREKIYRTTSIEDIKKGSDMVSLGSLVIGAIPIEWKDYKVYIELLKSTNLDIAGSAARALGGIDEYSDEMAAEIVPALLEMISKNRGLGVSQSAVNSLGAMGSKAFQAIDDLQLIIEQNRHADLVRSAQKALEKIQQ